MTEVSRDILFEAPIVVAYAVITDFEKYPKFLKDIQSVRVLKKTKTSAEVLFKLTLFKEIEYTLTFTLRAPTSVTWRLKTGGMFRKNSGSWKLQKLDANTTDAVYTLDVELGSFMPGMISRMLISQSLPATLKAFKKKIESSGEGVKY